MRTLSEATKKSLDEELFEYATIPHEIALRKLEIETEKAYEDDNIGGGSGGFISKVPEALTIKFSEDHRIQYLENLKAEVDTCYSLLTEEQRWIFDLRWLKGEANTWEEIAFKLPCSTKSIYRKREKILEVYAKIKGKI